MKQLLFIICGLVVALTAKADIITVNNEKNTPGSWLCFRKEIQIDDVKKQQSLRIAADTKYWLWVNGELVIREGGLKRGPNPQDTYCDVFDELKGLKKGKNTIAILVWYFGKDGFSHKNSPTAGVYFDLKIGKQNFTSDATWKAAIHPAFYVPSGKKPNYRLAESNIGYNAALDNKFYSINFDDSSWENAKEVTMKSSGWNDLVERPIPMWKDYGLKNYLKTTNQGDTLILADLPYNSHITPYIKLKATAGLKIDMRTDNYMGGGAPNVYAEYITKEGIQEFEAYGWMNGHQVRYTLPKGIEVIDVKFRETGYDTEFAGSFTCNDNYFNTLWKKSLRTLYVTMRDTYMDCPDRERSQWWGDVVNELGEAFYSLDSKAHLLTQKGIHELMYWQRKDSVIYAPVPSGNWNQELPMQMLASVGYYGFWTYYMGSGDKNTIADVYPYVRKYIHVWKTDNEGLVIPRKGGWTWGDWGENKDLTLLYNLWYSIALKGFENMALLIGEKDDAVWAANTNTRLKEVFHKKFWNGHYYVSPGYEGVPDDRSQALAIVAGILPKDKYNTIRPFFEKYYNASPYMEKYVLEALCTMGFENDALDRMKKRYKDMVESHLSTLWEGWGIGNKGYGGGSYNHAWSGGPLTILSQYFLGVSPSVPGFKEFNFHPRTGYLENLKGDIPTANGKISVSIERHGNTVKALLTVPEGLSANINTSEYKNLKIKGRKYKTLNGFYKLKSGNWEITYSML